MSNLNEKDYVENIQKEEEFFNMDTDWKLSNDSICNQISLSGKKTVEKIEDQEINSKNNLSINETDKIGDFEKNPAHQQKKIQSKKNFKNSLCEEILKTKKMKENVVYQSDSLKLNEEKKNLSKNNKKEIKSRNIKKSKNSKLEKKNRNSKSIKKEGFSSQKAYLYKTSQKRKFKNRQKDSNSEMNISIKNIELSIRRKKNKIKKPLISKKKTISKISKIEKNEKVEDGRIFFHEIMHYFSYLTKLDYDIIDPKINSSSCCKLISQ